MIPNSQAMKRLLQRCVPLVLAGACVSAPLATHAQSLKFVPVITTFSGTGTNGYIDGAPTSAEFASPHISDTDAAGNLYIPDTTNNVIRRIDPSGNTCTIGGNATNGTVCAGFPASTGATPATNHACASGSAFTATDAVGDGCPATLATFNGPKALRVDLFGNIAIADVSNNRIRSINAATGIVTTIVGTGSVNNETPFAAGALANAIKLHDPFDLAFDNAGNLYISDNADNYIVLVLAVNGQIVPTSSKAYVIAGNGSTCTSSATCKDGGLATSSLVELPRGITVDVAGNVYIADYTNDYIRRISAPIQNGTLNLANSYIAAYAGTPGTPGTAGTTSVPCCSLNGDGGPALQAYISNPQGIALDAAGNLYITEFNTGFEVIREVSAATGIITTAAGIGPGGSTGTNVPATSAELFSPAGLSFDRNGRMLIDDSSNNRIRLVQAMPLFAATSVGSSSAVSDVIGLASASVTPKTVGVTANTADFTTGTMTGSGCALNSALAAGKYCVVPVTFSPAAPGVRTTAVTITDSTGNKYVTGVAGIGNAPSIAFTPATISTIAGTGVAGSNNSSQATLAQVSAPRGSVIDATGSLIFADSGNNVIRRIDHSTGVITTLVGSGASGYAGDGSAATASTVKLTAPTGVVLDPAGDLYIADTGNNVIREVNAATGIITTVAGTGTASYTGDTGLATAATLSAPSGLAIDFAGRIYVADTNNNAIRRFVPNGGYIVTIAGTGTASYTGDTAQATLATLNKPAAVKVDTAGDVFIADTGNNVIREISPLGIINTVAGTYNVTSNSGDGSPATFASLQTPSDVVLDAAGNLYIAAGGVVRLVNAAGTINTIAGNGATGAYSGEGGSATSAAIPAPASNLAVDAAGNVYLSDTTGNIILQVADATGPTLNFGAQQLNNTSAAQTISLLNTGNLPLALSGITISSHYGQESTGSNPCTSTSTIAPGNSCTLSVTFTPALAGTTSGSVTLTDNALNGTAATQTISLTGTSGSPTATTLNPVPTSITYGNTVTLNATVTGTLPLTGSVVFTVDGVTAGTVPVANGQASLMLMQVAAGQRAVVATYTNDPVNASSFSAVTLPVAPAMLTVTANNVSQPYGTAIPAFAYTITGFVYGQNANVVTGSAVFTTAATANSPVGPYSIAESSSTLSAANYSFTYVNGTLTITPPDFTLTTSPSSITMAAGQTATLTVTLTPIGLYSGTVNFSCGTLPADVTCTFSSPSLTAIGDGTTLQTQLVIGTNGFNQVAAVVPARKPGTPFKNLAPFSLAALPFVLLLGSRKKRMRLQALLALCLFVSLGGLVACGNAGLNTAAKGTDHITLTVTDGNGLTHNVVITMTLQ